MSQSLPDGFEVDDVGHVYESHETSLWCAVLDQAISDHFYPDSKVRLREKWEAYWFLFAVGGPWAQSRHDACAVAGVDVEAFNDRVAEMERTRREALT
jgi:hypothetical protein